MNNSAANEVLKNTLFPTLNGSTGKPEYSEQYNAALEAVINASTIEDVSSIGRIAEEQLGRSLPGDSPAKLFYFRAVDLMAREKLKIMKGAS